MYDLFVGKKTLACLVENPYRIVLNYFNLINEASIIDKDLLSRYRYQNKTVNRNNFNAINRCFENV